MFLLNKQNGVSDLVINRLPRYYRFLGELVAEGEKRISSRELSEKMGITASQIRQDLNCFGGFGQQGYGYNIDMLYEEIGKILGLDKPSKTILIGAGNLGKAIATHVSFNEKGFELIGVFDKDLSLTEKIIGELKINSMDKLEDFCLKNKPECALLCIPKTAAANVCEKLISLGIKGFWNFSHYDLSVKYKNIAVENVHLGDSLMKLSYRIKNQ